MVYVFFCCFRAWRKMEVGLCKEDTVAGRVLAKWQLRRSPPQEGDDEELFLKPGMRGCTFWKRRSLLHKTKRRLLLLRLLFRRSNTEDLVVVFRADRSERPNSRNSARRVFSFRVIANGHSGSRCVWCWPSLYAKGEDLGGNDDEVSHFALCVDDRFIV